MIVATPLNLTKIEPDNWETFWTIWNRESDVLVKKRVNVPSSPAGVGSSSAWRGVDILKKTEVPTAWDAPFYDISNDLPEFYKHINTLPFKNVFRIRLISSLINIPAHTDNDVDVWSVRALLHCNDTHSQWYFSKPFNKENKKFFQLPSNTNWFAYNDKHCWHGTDYNKEYPKILLQVYMFDNPLDLINSSKEIYKDYTIEL